MVIAELRSRQYHVSLAICLPCPTATAGVATDLCRDGSRLGGGELLAPDAAECSQRHRCGGTDDNTSYLLSVHPAKHDLAVKVEVTMALAGGALVLLALRQKRWPTFGCGLGMLGGSSAIAFVPLIFRDQIPLPLLYSGIFSAWGLAIGHIAGSYFEQGICHFQEANLTGASFNHARLSWANFREASLTQTKFSHAITRGANFSASNQP